MGRYFGTDGFRGCVNKELNASHAFNVGRFLGSYYGKSKGCGGKIVIGKDTRRSSYMLEYALSAGICASGSDAYLLHVTTTPCVSYVARCEDFDCGIMISASHNPYYDNGIKILGSQGEKLSEEVTDIIEDYLDGKSEPIPFATGKEIGRTVDYSAGRNRYLGYLMSLAVHSYKGIRVGLDCANGSSWMIEKSVFEALGAKTYVINNEPDGFNINDNCGSTHIESLAGLVKKEGLDIGFAFDGDADRCLAVDCDGNVLTGDHIMYMCARYMKKRGELSGNTVVATVMSNMGLFKALEKEDIQYVKTNVGDRFVHEEMQKGAFSLGGEESGHIIFGKYANTGDGILTAIKIMEVFVESKRKSSELCRDFMLYPQYLVNVRVADKAAVMNDREIIRLVEDVQKKLGDSGRILLRKSGTEPVIRVMAEAGDERTCRESVETVVRKISEKGYADI